MLRFSLFFFISSISFAVENFVQDGFFHLHQTVGYLEAHRGQCLSGLVKARNQLETARIDVAHIADKDMDKILTEADKLLKIKSSSIREIESLRDRLHRYGQRKKLLHLLKWHQDIIECR